MIYEEKSKTLGISNPLSLSTYSYGKAGHSIYSIALVVCNTNWQVWKDSYMYACVWSLEVLEWDLG